MEEAKKKAEHWLKRKDEKSTFKTRWIMKTASLFVLCLIGCIIAIEVASASVITAPPAAAPADFNILANENSIFIIYLIFSAWGSAASAGLRKTEKGNGIIMADFFAGWGFGFCISGIICEFVATKWLNGVSLMAVAIAVSGIAGGGIVPLIKKMNEKGALDRAIEWLLKRGENGKRN